MTTIVELDGNIRDVIGNSSSKKLLRENKIPAVIYSEDKNKENIYIELDLRKFETEYLKGNRKVSDIKKYISKNSIEKYGKITKNVKITFVVRNDKLTIE